MPRAMPALEDEFRTRVSEAMKLAEIGEVARAEASVSSQTRKNLYPARLEYLYEMAYLKIFVSWEAFLEQVFLRYLCGYRSKVGVATPQTGFSFLPTLATAEGAILRGRSYVLWHNPAAILSSETLNHDGINGLPAGATGRQGHDPAGRHAGNGGIL